MTKGMANCAGQLSPFCHVYLCSEIEMSRSTATEGSTRDSFLGNFLIGWGRVQLSAGEVTLIGTSWWNVTTTVLAPGNRTY